MSCIKIQTNILPVLPGWEPAADTEPAKAPPAVPVRGEGEPTGVDELDGKLLLVWSGE